MVASSGTVVTMFNNIELVDALFTYPNKKENDGLRANIEGNTKQSKEMYIALLCKQKEDLDGSSALFCMPDSGECVCNDYFISAGFSTNCYNQNQIGTCNGVRTCAKDGLTACDATEPAQETCNNIDDDCNGKIDDVRIYSRALSTTEVTELYNYTDGAPPATCTSFTYSTWGACQTDSTQTRTTVSSSPDAKADMIFVLSFALINLSNLAYLIPISLNLSSRLLKC